MEQKAGFDKKGHLPIEHDFAYGLIRLKEKVGITADDMLDELKAVLNERETPDFCHTLTSLAKLSKSLLSDPEDLLPVDERGKKERDVVSEETEIRIRLRQEYFDHVTSFLADYLCGVLRHTSESGELEEEGFEGLSLIERINKFCWLSFMVGVRSQNFRVMEEFMRTLPNFLRAEEMDRSSYLHPPMEPRKKRDTNLHLKKWVKNTIETYRGIFSRFPSKADLQRIIETKIGELADPHSRPVDWCELSTDGKKRIRHRRDPKEQGATMKTITDTWLKDWRKEFKDLG